MSITTNNSLNLTLNKQRLVNVITMINLNILLGIARNLNDREKKSQ